MKTCIFLANGFEEGEAVNTIDILRRANIKIDIVSIYENQSDIIGSHNIIVKTEKNIFNVKDFSEYNCFILPGGKGVSELLKSNKLKEILIDANLKNKYIAAICAAPKILIEWKIITDHKIVHYPGVLKYNNVATNPVFVDRNIITGTSIGTSIQFGLLIVKILLNENKKNSIEKTLVIK